MYGEVAMYEEEQFYKRKDSDWDRVSEKIISIGGHTAFEEDGIGVVSVDLTIADISSVLPVLNSIDDYGIQYDSYRRRVMSPELTIHLTNQLHQIQDINLLAKYSASLIAHLDTRIDNSYTLSTIESLLSHDLPVLIEAIKSDTEFVPQNSIQYDYLLKYDAIPVAYMNSEDYLTTLHANIDNPDYFTPDNLKYGWLKDLILIDRFIECCPEYVTEIVNDGQPPYDVINHYAEKLGMDCITKEQYDYANSMSLPF